MTLKIREDLRDCICKPLVYNTISKVLFLFKQHSPKIKFGFRRMTIVHQNKIYCKLYNLWDDSFYPRLPNGKRKKFNVYAPTRDECETKLGEMIERVKAEIADEKAKQNEGTD